MSVLTFNPETGIGISSVSEVREQVRQEWVKAFTEQGKPTLNTEPETPAGQIIDSQTASICNKDEELLFLANQFNPLKAQGIWQDALAKLYFLTRQPALSSEVTVKCIGAKNTIIPEGALIQSTVDDTQWGAKTSGIISGDGYVNITFACLEKGPITAKPNTLKKILTVIPGWDSAVNEASAIVGQYEENQASFENRRYNSVAYNARSSIQSAYSQIASLQGVIACSIRTNRGDTEEQIDGVTLPPHSVYTCVLGGNDNEIANALYNTISAGCDYCGDIEVEISDPITKAKDKVKFSRPIEQPVGIFIKVNKNIYTPPNAEDVIKEVVFNSFYGLGDYTSQGEPVLRVVMGETVYASRFYAPLVDEGFKEIVEIKLALPNSADKADHIYIPININPTLSKEDINVTVLSEVSGD